MAEHPAVELLLELQDLLHKRIQGRLDEAAGRRYVALRNEILNDPKVGPHAPGFLRNERGLDAFFDYIRVAVPGTDGVWAARRAHVNEQLRGAFDAAERPAFAAADDDIRGALSALSSESVDLAWQRALGRQAADPAAALTAARSLLETVCKHVLDHRWAEYGTKDSLGDLYSAAAKSVGVHATQADGRLKEFLGACGNLATKIGDVRNAHGDSHGVGADAPAALHGMYGTLVVYLSGALATFLVDAWKAANQRDQQ